MQVQEKFLLSLTTENTLYALGYSPAKQIEDSKVPAALEKYLSSNSDIERVILHFDNDIAGRKAVAALKVILPEKYQVIDKPPRKGKDFNDFLCIQLGIAPNKNYERNDER